MKIKNSLVLLTALLFASVSYAQELQQSPSGLQYQIFTPNAGEKIKENDIITFNFIQKTEKDSVLFSSYDAGRPVKIQVQPSRSIGDLMDIFPLLSANDSVMVKVPTDSIFKEDESQRPDFFPKGSSLVFLIKIDKVQSLEEVMAEEKAEMAKLQEAEKAALNKYIADQKLKPETTASGLKYVITKASKKAKPASGDTVWVNYTGRTLDGKVFDSSIEEEAEKAGLEQPGRTYEPISFVLGEGQVIKGWDEGLALLNEGSQAKLLIPSELAYGPRGAGEDIEPFSSLVFDVELVKVKPAANAESDSAAPDTKSPVPAEKNPPAKKPAAKK